MSNTFFVDGVEYYIVRNPYTNGPMIARVDGIEISNRKEICRRFLRSHGWTNEMFIRPITNELERHINDMVNGVGNVPGKRIINTLSRDGGVRRQTITYRYDQQGEKVDLKLHVQKFIDIYRSDKNSRYLSYDHIRRAFINYRKDVSKLDLLTLNLYAYLASWGMLRNSFLMQKDYKFLTPITEILMKDKYDSLLNYDPFNDKGSDSARLMMEVINEMKEYFYGHQYFEEGSNDKKTIDNVSDTLVTKILLGTFGCSVAYDTYVRKGLSHHNLIQKVGIASILELRNFAKANEEEIKAILNNLNGLYTPMKIVDMYFFEEGFSL